MAEQRVLIVPFVALEMHGSTIICGLKDGVQWGIPLQIYNQYSSVVLDGDFEQKVEQKCESSSPVASGS